MKSARSRLRRRRFPPEIISYAVWVYHRFCMSFRDVEDLLAERSIIVSYEAVRQWYLKFGSDFAKRLKNRQGRLGDTWRPADAQKQCEAAVKTSVSRKEVSRSTREAWA